MRYSAKIIVYAADDPKVEESVRVALETPGAAIEEFSSRRAGDGEKELYAEMTLSDERLLVQIVRNVEAVKGAAVMAATQPKEVRSQKRAGG
jgi:hypothetical protein